MKKLYRVAEHIKNIFKRKYFFRGLVVLLLLIVLGFTYVVFITRENPIPNKLERERMNTAKNIVNDVTEINPVKVIGIIVPHTTEEIAQAVKNNNHVSIGGGRNSMGGQTASERAVQIDMREYNKILNFSTTTKEITVQSGIRWRDIQDYIDSYNLSVKIMQTYSNFTVGGSLSVNVHGRYIGLGPIILSVKKFIIVLADGSIIEASPEKHTEIFYSAIGGMGGIGVITDVTLALADNVNVERAQVKMPTSQYWDYFKAYVRSDPSVIFHNGDLYPPDFDSVSGVSWAKTDKAPTTESRLIPRAQDYWKERIAWIVMSEWPAGRWIREYIIDPVLYSATPPVHTRNYEASYDYAELEPEMRNQTTYVLQEYFVPVERFDEWVLKMKKVFNDNHVNVINVSIRHALADSGAKLAWAKKESFAFVVYYKQGTDDAAKKEVTMWTREMIDQVLSVGGTYYLPYQLQATDDQFHRAYPGAIEYFEIKNKYDPTDKFTNKLWDKYYSQEKLDYYKKIQTELTVASTTKEYYRPFDNAYLSIPEWYIVYSADEYATVLRDSLPSKFSYFGAIGDYWNQHRRVVEMTATSTHNNDDYKTVLNVIGWSFSIENIIKGLYENSIGRFFEWIAGNTQVAEDLYAAKVAKDYAVFIYDYPWYDFPYFSSLKGVWTLDNKQNYTWLQDIRRLERKLFLSLEFGIKTLYSKVIAFATHTKFGIQDDVVYAVVTRDGGKTYELVSAPHYQPFTKLLLNELESELRNKNFRIVDISGNKKITLTYQDDMGAPVASGAKELMRDVEINEIINSQMTYTDRITTEVAVENIPEVYRALRERDAAIDHFYDY
ncbi:MAG: FAD-binding protein [bacterium]|nr:FAD-binding protein [bacterium]